MSRPRFGVAGTGPWAQRLHIPAAAVSERVRFTAVLGRDAGRVEHVVAGTSARAYVQLEAFLDDVDIVGFAVDPAVQPRLAAAAVEAGKNVLLEKPVAFDARLAQLLAEAAGRVGVRSIVFLPHRLVPELDAWSTRARERGGWARGAVESWSSVLVDPSSAYHGSAWRHEGGALWDAGPHAVAQLTAVLGPVEAVTAQRGPGDLTRIVLQHQNGARATATIALDLPRPVPRATPTTFIGEAGQIEQPRVDDWDRFTLKAWRAAIDYLADSSAQPDHHTDIWFGAHLTAVLAAAQESIASGRTQAL